MGIVLTGDRLSGERCGTNTMSSAKATPTTGKDAVGWVVKVFWSVRLSGRLLPSIGAWLHV